MSAAAIIALITGLTGAIPELVTLIASLQNSSPASAADVLAILQKYGVDRAVFAANIAAAEAAGR